LSLLINSSGIILNRDAIEALLLSDVFSFRKILNELNGSLVDLHVIEDGNKKEIILMNSAKNSLFQLHYNLHNSLPAKLKIDYSDLSQKWSFEIKVLKISNQQKKCNFDF
jgi:hypothetical protein